MITRIRNKLRGLGLDALLVTGQANIRYISGFSCRESALLVAKMGPAVFLTDARNSEEARSRVFKNTRVVRIKRLAAEPFKKLAAKLGIKRLGLEEENISLGFFKSLKEALAGIGLVSTKGIIEDIRAVKTAEEIRIIRKNALITKKVLKKLSGYIKPGRTEIELAKVIEGLVNAVGAKPSFEPIVARGPDSAKPHAVPSKSRIKKRDIVLVDFGIFKDGYNTDITRMFFIGSPLKKLKILCEEVKTLQEMVINSIKDGVSTMDIFGKLSAHINKKRLTKFVLHSLGHGIGMEVHEKPFLSREDGIKLREGMILTVEPGLYVKGLGGARIEDMVLVTKNGSEVLTR